MSKYKFELKDDVFKTLKIKKCVLPDFVYNILAQEDATVINTLRVKYWGEEAILKALKERGFNCTIETYNHFNDPVDVRVKDTNYIIRKVI